MRINKHYYIHVLFLFLILTHYISSNLYSGSLHPVKQIMRYHMDSSPVEAFKIWHYLHNRQYKFDSIEGLKRYEIFKNNFNIVKKHNTKSDKNYSLGLNNFADMTTQEFKEKYLLTNGKLFSQIKKLEIPVNQDIKIDIKNFWDMNLSEKDEDAYLELFLENKKNLFDFKSNLTGSPNLQKDKIDFHNIDWTERAQLHRKVENQKHCGSCWAFSTIQSIQAAYTIKTGNYITLSKQELVDCDSSSKGCNGGLMHTAMDYIKKNGIDLEEDYQYTGIDGQCQIKKESFLENKNNKKLTISSYEGCIDKEECMNDESLFEVLKRGPVSAVVDASEEFMLYDEGIFDKPCKQPNHAILLTGFYLRKNEQNYWVVKNSWGPVWGDHGFIKIKQSKDYNSCMLNTYYVRPDI